VSGERREREQGKGRRGMENRTGEIREMQRFMGFGIFLSAPVATELTIGILSALLVISVVSCEKADKTKAPEIIKTKTGMEMVMIPAGQFEMGSSGGEADESPVHRVWVDAFLMDRYEVTQEQYSRLIMADPSHFKGASNPVEQVSWAHAALYCNARSREEGLEPCYDEASGECNFQASGYRLPTEAEWEYACRAGTDTERFFGRDARALRDYAWHADNSFEKAHPVGQKKPNSWGLYDMYGNVAEWCNDIYGKSYYEKSPEKNPQGAEDGEKYVLRGGSWSSSADSCRSAYRVGEDPGFNDACFARDDIGFRCVRRAAVRTQDARLKTQDSRFKTQDSRPKTQDSNLTSSIEYLTSSIKHQASSIKYQISSIQYPASSIQHPVSSIEHQASKTGFVYQDIYLQHKTGSGHPETPQRLEAIVQRLNPASSSMQLLAPRSSSYSLEWVKAIHTPEYVKRVRDSCQEGVKYMDSVDTPISSESYEAALAAVGGVLSAVDEVMAGNVSNAFCAIRPPGHHALKDRAMGFCLFNNVAIGARYVQKKCGLSKVLIVDWDVHHGNGTQAAFYDDPTVLYFSTHQYPFYPGTGSEEERGTGKGLGYNINVPLPAGSGDEEYIKAFKEILKPRALQFKPDFVLISAGFDAHKDDLLGGMNVTVKGFEEMTAIVKDIAETCCNGRIVSVLEGGYSLSGLAESVEAHILVLQE
jgi:acetoin utilization deacetylase AcuC-like enzyme/formylglycine-generating enzyme required for sulfatase activity